MLMTGFADGTLERWGGEHYEVLMKPFTAEKLTGRIKDLLDRPAR
jgi:hypothetical protein